MGQLIQVKIESYIWVVRQMYNRGEISLENYATCLRRAKERI